ncbi:MAG: hypothetical protein GX493_01800, partial [Firmicutes bacterium]|nr:hypothetical protein [Bacillota bacterium]
RPLRLPPLVWQNALLTFSLSLFLAGIFSFVSFLPAMVSLFTLLTIIGVGIVFDMIGVAVAAADETPFHAMASDRVSGSREAVWLIRQAERVANFCNDVVGDVCNTVTGAITAALAVVLAARYRLDQSLVSILAIAMVAALNVGGKAMGKVYALGRPEEILLFVGRGFARLGWPRLDRRPSRRRVAREKKGS